MKRQRTDIKKIIKKKIEIRHERYAFIDKRQSIKNDEFKIVDIRKNEKISQEDVRNICVFNQFFGLGDILFIEPIMRKYFQYGYKIVLPVLEQYLSLKSYFPYIEFVRKDLYNINYNEKKIINKNNKLILPLRWSKEYFIGSTFEDTMRNKYRMVNIDLNEWRTLTWLRHRYKEENLKKILNINDGDKYNLINKNFHTFKNKKININIDNGIKNIEIDFIDGYTLLDWSSIIENATTIHTVDTSLLYLLEVLDLSTEDIHIYQRYEGKNDFRKTEYLFKKNFIRH